MQLNFDDQEENGYFCIQRAYYQEWKDKLPNEWHCCYKGAI